MNSAEVYAWLMNGSGHPACDRFDAHVVASVVSLALVESVEGSRPVAECVGLEPHELTQLVGETFPHARDVFEGLESTLPLTRAAVETCLRDLLTQCTTNGTPLQDRLASILARRSQRPNHLWQDLGLRNRRELSWLMGRHFEWLASRNARDMKWKKFLYRTICRDGSYPVCTAPSCSECSDFETCFGAEDGERLLAVARRDAELSERRAAPR
jgi:nitrogen fixation protein NifQ